MHFQPTPSMKKLVAGLLLALPVAALAQPVEAVPARTQVEIDHLFDYLAHANCQFNRNGSWHDMVAAKAHVNTKYEYLKERGKIDSTESFIENAASKEQLQRQGLPGAVPGRGPRAERLLAEGRAFALSPKPEGLTFPDLVIQLPESCVGLL